MEWTVLGASSCGMWERRESGEGQCIQGASQLLGLVSELGGEHCGVLASTSFFAASSLNLLPS